MLSSISSICEHGNIDFFRSEAFNSTIGIFIGAAYAGSIFPFEIAKNCVVSDSTFHLAGLTIMI
jgi:hypothetical protein